jgi:hypothetical protein
MPPSKRPRNLFDNAEATPARMTNPALQDHVGILRLLFASRREGYLPFSSIGLSKRQHLKATPACMTNLALPDDVSIRRHLWYQDENDIINIRP